MIKDYFAGKRIIWTKYIKVYCDNGHPKYFIIPAIYREYFHRHWNLKGFRIVWLGREFHFVFGEVKNEFYD